MTRIDRRFLDRRRHVREDGARRHLRWGIALVAIAAVSAVSILLFRSPLLAVREVRISGVVEADVAGVLERHQVGVGVPTITVRASRLEEEIEADPWVARASVRVTWPGSVEVAVLEHAAAAWIELDRGWMLVSATGIVLEAGEPPRRAPRVLLDAAGSLPGQTLEGPAALAALEFLSALPGRLSAGAVVRGSDASLKAIVQGHKVSLGSPTDMAAKARALVALFESGIHEGARVNLIAPSFPAVSNPQPQLDPIGVASSEASG